MGARGRRAAAEPVSAFAGRHTRARRRRRISERAGSQLAQKNRGGKSGNQPVAGERWWGGRAAAIARAAGGPRRQSRWRPETSRYHGAVGHLYRLEFPKPVDWGDRTGLSFDQIGRAHV